MDRRSKAILSLSLVTALALLVPVGALAKGPPVRVETTNNLSFPAIAVDGFTINTVAPSFTVPYTGDYPGLTADEITALQATGPWYAQKVTGNTWQADWASQSEVDVDVVDWGDNIESVDAFVRRPYRLEVVLFDNTLAETMTGYTMAMLGNPSSPDEIQGANTATYEGTSATVISSKPKLVIQALGMAEPATLTWDVATSRWLNGTAALSTTQIGFAPELNVAGKYIYGASTGGWKPTVAGVYRVTFYIPTDSTVNLQLATIAVPVPEEAVIAEAEEGGGATPVIDSVHNLTYVDITVQARNR